MIEIKNIKKKYGNNLVIDDLSFTINDKEVIGFLGPNGAGKSTVMNMITGYVSTDAGEILYNGKDIFIDKNVKKKIGYLPEIPPLYEDMTVLEYLTFVFELKKVDLVSIGKFCSKKEYVYEIMSLANVTEIARKLIRNVSKGFKQRVGFAEALIGNPEVIILDEPTIGLDPAQIIEIRNTLKQLSLNCSIILSSHILSEISLICTKIIIINKGKILVENRPSELYKGVNTENKIIVEVEGFRNDVLNVLWQIPGIIRVKVLDKLFDKAYKILIETRIDVNIEESLGMNFLKNDMKLLSFKYIENSLEEIFLKYIKRDDGTLLKREVCDMDFGHDLPSEDRGVTEEEISEKYHEFEKRYTERKNFDDTITEKSCATEKNGDKMRDNFEITNKCGDNVRNHDIGNESSVRDSFDEVVNKERDLKNDSANVTNGMFCEDEGSLSLRQDEKKRQEKEQNKCNRNYENGGDDESDI